MVRHMAWALALAGCAGFSAVRAQWDTGYHSSTVIEGSQRGMADLVRSAGQSNLMNSEAAKNYEEARSMNLDNRLKYTDTYFQQKQINKQYKEADRAAKKYAAESFRAEGNHGIKPPNAREIDPVSGQVHWPRLLQGQQFAEGREFFDSMYKAKATEPSLLLSTDDVSQSSLMSRAMIDALKKLVKDVPPPEYMAARTFVQKLNIGLRQS